MMWVIAIFVEMRDTDEDAPSEIEARKYGLSFIKLDGNIGCMVNGAGLAMTSMDVIKLFGGEPANFLDVGGGAPAEKVADAMRTLPETGRVMTISSALETGMIRLCVADSGPGVPAAAMDKLFEPFWTTKAEGMGIGLAVCRSIVAAHHGTLDVENAPEGGAVFCARLPASTTP